MDLKFLIILAATCTLKGAISDIDIYYNKFELLQIIVNILTCLRFSCSTLGGLTQKSHAFSGIPDDFYLK
jgi:hypothetical protein